MNESDRQRRLLLWRDYFELLKSGMALSDKGAGDNPWDEEGVEIMTWLDVLTTELESDVMHLEQEQEKYCTWEETPKDLSEFSVNDEP